MPHITLRASRRTVAVFLLTPSFAPWLDEHNTFLQRLADRLFLSRPPGTIRILTAVVDKLPAPIVPHVQDKSSVDSAFQESVPLGSQTGFEGIAYAGSAVIETRPKFAPYSGDPFYGADEPLEPGRISFYHSFQPPNTPETHRTDTRYTLYQLHLPLANTIFHTGRRSTMVYSKWTKEDGQEEARCQARTYIRRMKLNLGGKALKWRSDGILSMSIPLLPLTMPRKIEEGMGNIVRRVIGSSDTGITASTELEDAVPRFFEARGQPPQSMAAWALVMPKSVMKSVLSSTKSMLANPVGSIDSADAEPSAESWKSLWQNNELKHPDFVAKAIAQGARLHRILSGGGGWGKKAGLLALDPEIGYDESFSSSPADHQDGPGTSTNIWGSAHDLVKPGDFIQFFTTSTAPSSDTDLQDAQTDQVAVNWEFGTLPSTMDAMPTSPPMSSISDDSGVSLFRNYFGALTEGALTMRAETISETPSGKKTEAINATKIDVPHSQLRFTNVRLGV